MRDVYGKTTVGKTFNSIADACDAIEGMSRTCVKLLQRFPDVDGEYTLTNPEKMVTVWSDDHTRLGDVGYKYQVVQYRDCFNIAGPLLERGFRIVGGGLINLGERACLILESNEVIELGNGDEIVNRLVLLSSHDGTGKIELVMTPYRKKTGSAQVLDIPGLSFKHTLNVHNRIGAGRKAFAKIEKAWDDYSTGARRMQMCEMTDANARAFIEQVLPSKTKEVSTKLENLREDIYQVYKNTGIGRHNIKCRGTLFGLVQAVSEWADHHATVRASSKRNSAATDFDFKLLNTGAKKKAQAWSAGLTLMKLRLKGAVS
jgi:phage/plasmid-like protein (TIGR03299 family)